MTRALPSSFYRLVEAARDFGRTNPGLGDVLGGRIADPAVERIREAIFFLGATVIDRVGWFEMESHEALANVVAPDLARPFPAATVVELTSSHGVVHVPSGSELRAPLRPAVRFRTVGDLEVTSARASNCRVEPEERMSLRFELTSSEGAPLAHALGSSVRLYIDEPREAALALLHHLSSHTSLVEVRRLDQSTVAVPLLDAFGFAPNHTLAPEPDGVPGGAAILREYFLLPEKFLLVDVVGVREALESRADTAATVIFRFDAPLPASVRLGPSSLVANCTPAVNLFDTTAEPRLCSPASASYPLRPSGLGRDLASVYAVTRISARDPHEGAPPVIVPPARRFVHDAEATFPYAYLTKLQQGARGAEPETHLLLTSPRRSQPVMSPHVISATLVATNRHAGASVKPGELTELIAHPNGRVTARNLIPTSPYVPAPSAAGFALRALVLGQVPAADPLATLKSVLYARVPSMGVQTAAARGLTARVDALERLEVSVVANGARTRQGYLARFEIDDTAFSGPGDVALWLRVVQRLVETRTTTNHFVRCEMSSTKSGRRWVWPSPEGA